MELTTILVPAETFFSHAWSTVYKDGYFEWCNKRYQYDSANTYPFLENTIEVWCYEINSNNIQNKEESQWH